MTNIFVSSYRTWTLIVSIPSLLFLLICCDGLLPGLLHEEITSRHNVAHPFPPAPVVASDKCQQIIDQGNMLASSIQSAYRRRIETLPESVRNMTLAELFNTYNDNFEDVTRLNVAKMQESLEDFARTVSKGAGGSRFEVHENLCGMTPGVRTVLRSTRKLAGIDMSNIIQAPHENVPGSLRRSARNAAASNNSSNNTATSGVVAHSAAAGGVAATPSVRFIFRVY